MSLGGFSWNQMISACLPLRICTTTTRIPEHTMKIPQRKFINLVSCWWPKRGACCLRCLHDLEKYFMSQIGTRKHVLTWYNSNYLTLINISTSQLQWGDTITPWPWGCCKAAQILWQQVKNNNLCSSLYPVVSKSLKHRQSTDERMNMQRKYGVNRVYNRNGLKH